MDGRRECTSDFLEITDVERKVLVRRLCGAWHGADATPLFSIKVIFRCRLLSFVASYRLQGPIALRFVTNSSMMHDVKRKRKNHRGFKISYAVSGKKLKPQLVLAVRILTAQCLADCGGEISLADANNHRSAVISSPGYPLNYHDNLDCVWNITTTSDRIIAFKYVLRVYPRRRYFYTRFHLNDLDTWTCRSKPALSAGLTMWKCSMAQLWRTKRP